ncbi:MAG: hypothetical protein EHM55_21765 [Acidobacteria bacterium]|nr:MAG: hypothetical protein EHM55_21765 [Acidobacteriota bacterium]
MDADDHRWDDALVALRNQDLALFARRAHAQLGRGFVLVERNESKPVYITRVAGGPLPLIDAVSSYNPEEEALLVFDEGEPGGVTMSIVTIQKVH